MANEGSRVSGNRRARCYAAAALLIAYAAAWGSPLHAQAVRTIATFSDARAVSVDPAGVVYVVEGARETIVTLHPDGRPIARLGGRGAAAGQFDRLADVDPANGLVIVAADAGNGRIQRFSSEFLFLESVAVDAGDEVDRDRHRAYRKQDQEALSGSGRPLAVATNASDETFVVEGDRGVVLKWSRERSFERTIGGYDAGPGALGEPVDLAIDDRSRSLFVLDRGRGDIAVYDLSGVYERSMGAGLAADAVAIDADGDRLFLVLPDALVAFSTRGLQEAMLPVEIDTPLVDAAVVTEGAYLLTRQALYWMPIELP